MINESNSTVPCEKYIGANFHVTVVDSRILEGILTVIDPFGNLLLSNVYETSIDKFDKTKLHVRELGLVSVPRETIVNIKVDSRTYNNIFGKS